jgi:uncharacterized repeat protein (TIGR03803 family)
MHIKISKKHFCAAATCAALIVSAGSAQAHREFHLLYTFTGSNGGYAVAAPILDSSGNIYGATQAGGGSGCKHLGCGTVFRYSPDGSMTILHAFSDRQGSPNGVTFGPDGALYGAAFSYDDQSRGGILFRLDP